MNDDLRARTIEWTDGLTQGELLDRFAAHCRDDLDDVELLAAQPTRLELRLRDGEGSVELRSDLAGVERLEGVHLILAPIDEGGSESHTMNWIALALLLAAGLPLAAVLWARS